MRSSRDDAHRSTAYSTRLAFRASTRWRRPPRTQRQDGDAMAPRPPIHRWLVAAATLVTSVACEREERRLNQRPPNPPVVFVSQSTLQPGPTFVSDTAEGPFDDNAY